MSLKPIDRKKRRAVKEHTSKKRKCKKMWENEHEKIPIEKIYKDAKPQLLPILTILKTIYRMTFLWISLSGTHLHWLMESGRAVNLFPETLRSFNFCNKPINSGSDSKRFEEILSSSRFCNSTIESGITYYAAKINN